MNESLDLLVVGVWRIVNSIVKAAALLALKRKAGDQVADVDHVKKLTDVL